MQRRLRGITLQGAISILEKRIIGWHHNYFVFSPTVESIMFKLKSQIWSIIFTFTALNVFLKYRLRSELCESGTKRYSEIDQH